MWSLNVDGADLGHACFSTGRNRILQESQVPATASAVLWAGLGSGFGRWLWWVCLVYVGSSRWVKCRIVGSLAGTGVGTRASFRTGPKQPQDHRWGLDPMFLEICFSGLT